MKYKSITFTIIALSIALASCNKYEDGPMISFSSPEKRIVGDYTVNVYYINEEIVSLADMGISEYRLVYNADGTGKQYITVNDHTNISDLEWEFDEKKETFRERVKGQNDQWSSWSNYKTIIRLTKKEFWFIDDNSAEKTEIHLIEQ